MLSPRTLVFPGAITGSGGLATSPWTLCHVSPCQPGAAVPQRDLPWQDCSAGLPRSPALGSLGQPLREPFSLLHDPVPLAPGIRARVPGHSSVPELPLANLNSVTSESWALASKGCLARGGHRRCGFGGGVTVQGSPTASPAGALGTSDMLLTLDLNHVFPYQVV